VIEDLPSNTDFPFKILISYATFRQFEGDGFMTEWNSVSDVNQSYLVLPAGVDKVGMEHQIAQVHASHVPKELSSMRTYRLQPLREVHRDPRYGNFNMRTVTLQNIWALGIIGGFLLIMVCINFINLSTAHAITRSKDVGIRKVLGSTRWQVIGQSITETLLIIVFSITIALIASTLILSQIQSLTRTKISHAIYTDPFVWTCLVILAIAITLLAGLYPALSLSRYKPILAIKNTFNSKIGNSVTLREILLLTQFTLMQILIIATFIAVKQMHFFRNVDMGFNKEAVINVEVPQGTSTDKLDAFRNDMLSLSSISQVSFSSTLPSGLKRPIWSWGIRRAGADQRENLVFEYQSVDQNYLDLYDIELLAGKGFTKSSDRYQIIINQTLSSKLGFPTPEEAINHEVIVMDESVTVIGVMQDIHTNSLKSELSKVALMTWPDDYRRASIKLNVPVQASTSYHELEQTLAYIEHKWNHHFEGNVFSYSFLDDNVQAFYQEEARITNLFQVFSFVFMVIGCLGLFGLVSFVVHKKTREVAVRKVLGASITQILMLFSIDYIKQVVIAFGLAVPVAYYFMSKWLNGFAYQIDLHWWLFVLPGVLVLVMVLLSVSGTTWRSAMANPTVSLRNE
jgi:putative ABC transport system permease protein